MLQKLEAFPHALLLKGEGRKKQVKYQPHPLLARDYIGEVTG